MPGTGILLVDDSAESLTALRATLEPLGARIVTASSGPEALRHLLREQYAVVLLDVRMPGMNGYDVATYMRQREATRRIPLIFLSAAGDAELEFRGYEAGAVDFVQKPVDPVVLLSKVSVFVELSRARAEMQRQEALLHERELTELARESDARYRLLAETVPEQVWRALAGGELDYVSKRFTDYVGLDRGEVLAGTWLRFVDERDLERCSRLWSVSLETGSPFESEVRLVAADGSSRWHLVRAAPYSNEHGIACWVGANVDIDVRKQTELERARLLEQEAAARAEAERGEQRSRFLADVSSTLEEQGTLHERAERFLRLCVPAIADFATLENVRPDGRREILGVAHRDAELELRLRDLLEQVEARNGSALLLSPLEGSGVLVADVSPEQRRLLDGRRDPARGPTLAPLSAIGVPIRTGEGRGGVLTMWTSEASGRRFDTGDLAFVEELGLRLGVGLENARLTVAHRRISRALQMSLLAGSSAANRDVSTAVRYIAAGEDMQVGGDWYDVFDLDGGRVGVTVGDVVGRGLRAATAMAKLRSAVRALALVCESPAQLLTELDRFAAGTDGALLTTVAYAVIDSAAGVVQHACAGHPPPLLRAPDGSVAFLEGGRGAPLAAFPLPREDAVVELAPGSTLLLYSDGLVERRGEPLDVGFERLASVVETASDRSIESLADTVLGELVPTAGLADDVALLCVRLEPANALRFTRRFPALPEELAPARRSLRAWLAEVGVSPEATADVLLACGEACANAIEHAYGGQGDADISIELRRLGDDLLLVVRDTGTWQPAAIPGDRGRGLMLMRATMDDVRLRSGDSGTTVAMEKRVGSEAAIETGTPELRG